MAAAQAITNSVFEDDDEETQCLLAHVSDDESLSSRLESLSKRFREDHENTALDAHWNGFVSAAKAHGFCPAESSKTSESPDSLSSPMSLPDAFKSEDGKKHLEATKALLGLTSEHRAGQLTMCSLRDMKDSKNLQALLGTRRLVIMVANYYYRQRSARISTIAELLRQEQDENGPIATVSAILLGELDSSYSIDGKERGLFKILLSIACRKMDGQLLSREQLAKSRALSAGTPTTLRESIGQPASDKAWHQFAVQFLDSTRNSIREERVRAMEALVALLYTRIQGGVSRLDYMIVLKAFYSANNFFTVPEESEKISQLAGLVCAECAGLWRVFADNPTSFAWVKDHPMLVGLLEGAAPAQAERELDALNTYLGVLKEEHARRQQDGMAIRPIAPESLASLALGLLMMTSYEAILQSQWGSDKHGCWQTFHEKGQNLVMVASSDLAAFDHFHAIMMSLVRDPPQRSSNRQHSDLPYDWLLLGMSEPERMEITEDTTTMGRDMDGASLIYGSIGTEVVSSLITAFGDSILAPGHERMQDNLSLICDLSASIYRSSPTLCSRFWIDWDLFTDPENQALLQTSKWPMCKIVDLAFSLVRDNNAGRLNDKATVLRSSALLMQILASLCYSSERVEGAFALLEPTMLHNGLHSCALDADAQSNESFSQNRRRFLWSLSAMTRLGNSTSCRTMMREALESPAVLFNVLRTSDSQCSELALDVAADLLMEAPVEWTLSFARGMETLLSMNVFERSEALFALARVFSALAASIPLFAFSDKISDGETTFVLELIWRGVLRLSPVLPLCLSNITTTSVPLKTVTAILDFFASFLENLGTMTTSRRGFSGHATRMRSAVIELMGSHIGEASMFFALLPFSFSIAERIESYAEEQNILQSASMQENNLGGKYGAWHATATCGSFSPSRETEEEALVKGLVAKTTANMEKVSECTGEEIDEIMLCVSKAMSLLRLWAINVEEVAKGEVETNQLVAGLNQEQQERLSSLSPLNLLFMVSALPNPIRAKGDVKALFETVSPLNFEIFCKHIEVGAWPLSLSAMALDFLHTCISHVKLGSTQGPLTAAVERSNLFGLLTPLAVGGMDMAGGKTAASEGRAREAQVCSILAFRLASVALAALPTVSGNAGEAASRMMKAAFGGVERACNNLHQYREAKKRLDLQSHLLPDLLGSTACLCFLASVWDDAKRLNGALLNTKLPDKYDSESGAFTALAKVLLQHAHSESEINQTASGCLCSFLAAAVHFLKLATELAMAREELKTCSVMGMVKENALQLISMPHNFLTIVLDTAESKSIPQTLFAQFPVVATSGDTFFNVDCTSMALCFPTESKDGIFKTALSDYNFTSQVKLQNRWKEFAGVLLRLSSPSQPAIVGGLSDNALISQSESHSKQYVAAALDVLRVIAKNSTKIAIAAADGAALKVEDISQMGESTGTVLVLLSTAGISEAKRPNLDVLKELFGLITFCATKLFNVLEKNAEPVEQNLLTAACLILTAEPTLKPGEAVEQLVEVVCRLLQLLEVKVADNTACLRTIVVLLTLLVGAQGTEFIDGKILNLLVSQASAYSQSGAESEEKMQVLESIVDFFHALLEAPTNKILELVSNGAMQQLLTSNPILERAGQSFAAAKLRGYIPTKEPFGVQSQSTTSFFPGKNDPEHTLWRAALRCFRTFCRSTRQSRQSPSKKERLGLLVSDFIQHHQTTMLACLKTVESSPFTKNTLQEAHLVLSLLSEFCFRPRRDGTIRQMVSALFIPEALKLVSRLANFLGASSASRELFTSMGDSDSSEDSHLDLTARQSPFNRVHNARHEAIRYSHHASRFFTAVTHEEHSESSSVKGKGRDDLRDQSATALEKHGKALMNSDFARTMELSAADCLFATLSFLWENHPANACFVMFDQTSVIDAMPLVKEGMVIGFCSHQESQRPWRLGYVHFAEVLRVNTLNRSWYVRSLESDKSEMVKANQIVGMEDTSKRRCVLRFAPAADSATELENNSHTVSVGHLILALRWCSVISKPSQAVGRLAGLASCFLGAEMETHKVIGSALSKSREPVVLERLYAQLFDLFGDTRGTQGRLKGILNQKSWAAIGRQICDELQSAAEARENEAMVVEDEGLFLGNSGGRNPFHDLRMNY